ncbi:N-acetylglucosamine-6-phosphate deacetylase isoform X1 [Patella vulgata]|uniref:N-acetylglucosamine-6-phosphate deacetylase isoform X1 n=1 Tax=Patella vulgata TaxID=6465 RepID=UPI0024A965C3|nr:N-acetylglucosamine-6-phosphate deacetylase isoform X1 [Patella vulgata]XP_050417643.2 N-acetylglucosamine-6-phosphate deacetylase isoform X1 [Patella vulgata]
MFSNAEGKLFQYRNCRILKDHKIYTEDLWVRDGKIVNPEKIFFEEKILADYQIDCKNKILAPGFIETQINGAFGVDFSQEETIINGGIGKVCNGLLEQGITSFCPTVITSPSLAYKKILPLIKKTKGSKDGAGIIGVHVEGPFISKEKKGAHQEELIQTFDNGFKDLIDMYGDLSNIAIITLAPELHNSQQIIKECVNRGIIVSLGHSMANLVTGEEAIWNGASYVTHLFNAMLPFHHRDPHLVGLLTSNKLPPDTQIYYGIIADGIHTHPAALRIAQRINPKGLVLVTDAIQAMGLPEGKYKFGCQQIEIKDNRATVAGTNTLCGSIVSMDKCVRQLAKSTECGHVLALETASLHPAKVLQISNSKGTLDFDTDADFILLSEDLHIQATFIAGELVWQRSGDVISVITRTD